MKLVGSWTFALWAWLLAGSTQGARLLRREASAAPERAITKVVNLLEQMLEKSQAEGVKERELFTKHKCYCDTNEEEKTTTVAQLDEDIALLQNKIESLKASTAILSQEVADLAKKIEDNQQQQTDATSMRHDEHQQYIYKRDNLTQAIGQMQAALQQLDAVGADQTLAEDASHTQFMAGYNETDLIELKGVVTKALVAASSFDTTLKKEKAFDAFLQAPFNEAYVAQSGEVVGILKEMRDTFEANLNAATMAENTANATYTEFMKVLTEAETEMQDAHDTKQGTLGTNDDTLGSDKTKLANSESDRKDAAQFLVLLEDTCTAKAKDYDNRVKLRATEEAAISQAIAILNSDAAFATFGKVAATSSTDDGATGPGTTAAPGPPAFFQVALAKRAPSATAAGITARRQQASALLRKADRGQKSGVLSRIVGLLQAENPFAIVLEEIQKMIDLIADEEEADVAKNEWCTTERSAKGADLNSTKSQIIALKAGIVGLKNDINDPETGLVALIKQAEDSLAGNRANQQTETETRKEENQLYQENIATLVEAQELLSKALVVLKAYYQEALASSALLQRKKSGGKEDPAPPETWQGEYKGQSQGGSSAISMVQFILDETHKEETTAHDAEAASQQSYEESMSSYKEQETDLGKSIANNQLELAAKREDLVGKEGDLKDTEAVEARIEAYLEKIRPGCAFIQDNLVSRNQSRTQEVSALDNAAELLRDTPVYKTSVAEAHNETLGACADVCVRMGEDHAECRACVSDTSLPGYCAGHPGTPGC